MIQQPVIDQMGRVVLIPDPPMRIVSLVPSQTELLFDLGLGARVVGVTKFCVHPDEAKKTKTIVGGTKKFWFDVIDQLNPDLIMGNKEENYEDGIARLVSKYSVWMSDIVTFDDALDMIRAVGHITQTTVEANALTSKIELGWSTLRLATQRVVYLIWQEPWMAAGAGTFIHSVIEKIGWHNAVEAPRYPELTDDELIRLNPGLILLSSEPYPFREPHLARLRQLCPGAQVKLVDGERFSWYGSQMLHAPAYFKSL